jgi:hypothetical protein
VSYEAFVLSGAAMNNAQPRSSMPTPVKQLMEAANAVVPKITPLARLGLRVKMMIDGVTGWIDEAFTATPS